MAEERENENKNGDTTRISVGYALPPKKVDSILNPSLLTYAKSHAVDFIPIDVNQPLIHQGPFDCVLHKIYDDDWSNQLLDFASKNPSIPIIDSPTAIQRLHDRISMLEAVENLVIPSSTEETAAMVPSVGIPKQVLLRDEDEIENLGLKFPVIAKPLVANGSIKSHQMSLVFNSNGLKKLKNQTPIVLQEFVNHGGVLFKVYVAGKNVRCVQRKSLPDFDVTVDHFEDVMPFSQISNLPTSEKQQLVDNVAMPPMEFVNGLASALREGAQLNLFNFDLIRDGSESSGVKYLIIDINYFPGYAKLPEFEAMLTDFFLDVVSSSRSGVEKA
ncbi:inositol-tetrakisphosphate 1-kinase 1-like [Chenopodium quinoa]|uniref:inositol-tetrakisphosphate 1-kinase 1-like n=1 Tax=Chenopodium quinoa TaxID=63459 RepID=UPI000B76D9F3|nr:inositol-tetrakisphosphate 1-kinase 1-like [Chenopodium quinoa]